MAQSEVDAGQWALADARLSGLLRTQPADPRALRLKAHVSLMRGQPNLTAELLNQVASLEGSPQAWLDAAVAHRRVADLKAAEGAVRAYLQLLPGDATGLLALAELLHHSGRPGEALRVLESMPASDSEADLVRLHLLSRVLGDLGRHHDSIQCLRQVHARNPASCWSELLARIAEDLQMPGPAYLDEVKKILPLEFQRWVHPEQIFPRGQDPRKRLRIGYVSSDFRGHAVSSYILGLFQARDRDENELFLFSQVPSPDAMTTRFKNLADGWIPIFGQSDAEVSAKIMQLGIDVLVDLNGFTGGHRLGLFARRSAPIQAVYTAGFGPTRGMPNLDVKFTDDFRESPGEAQVCNTETLISLEGPRIHFTWPSEAPEPGPLPCSSGGPFTFGCLNSIHKLEERTIELFASILKAEPQARLLLMWPSLEDKLGLQDRRNCFEALGVLPSQLEFVPRTTRANYLGYYHRVDLALDPLSAFGMTTVLEAIWMGVPVLHFDPPGGMRHPGRYFARQLGLGQWVVDSIPAYVAQARAWMKRPEELAELRRALRPRAAASALSDAPAVARTMEGAYRRLWVDWCEGRFPYRISAQT